VRQVPFARRPGRERGSNPSSRRARPR
jgi:hypothetical protein